MAWNEAQWEQSAKRLPKFLSPLVQDLGRSERRVGATLYVEGLLMPGQRKSIGPMAERLGVDSQKLQQFITDSPWEESAIWKAIRPLAADCLEPLEAWIVDETGWLKQGEHSVGVAHQYCGAAGKSANCQVNVQVAITDGLVAGTSGCTTVFAGELDQRPCTLPGGGSSRPGRVCDQTADRPEPYPGRAGGWSCPSAGAGR